MKKTTYTVSEAARRLEISRQAILGAVYEGVLERRTDGTISANHLRRYAAKANRQHTFRKLVRICVCRWCKEQWDVEAQGDMCPSCK